MTGEEYQEKLKLLIQAARLVHLVDPFDLINRINRAESVGPLVDPTLYRANAKKMQEDKDLIEATLPLARYANILAEHKVPE